MRLDETWTFDGDPFSDSFNPRRAIRSDHGRLGYFKLLRDDLAPDPWIEQWANEHIVAELASALDIACVEASANHVEDQLGAIVVFTEGRKVSELAALGFQVRPVMEGASNREQYGLMVAFDVWTLNVDRSENNLFIATEDGRPRVLLIDHGHTLLTPRSDKAGADTGADLQELLESRKLETQEWTLRLLQGNYVYAYTTPEEIRAGARTIADVTNDVILHALEDVPTEFLVCGTDVMFTLLSQRRDCLCDLIEACIT